MADPAWGALAKAQDDPQTIDQAIAAAIATHESDSDAHLGAGESLETHKSQEVIDHPAGSVLGDKQTWGELVITDNFTVPGRWNKIGAWEEFDLHGVNLHIEAATEVKAFYTQPANGQWDIDAADDGMVQIAVEFASDEEKATVHTGAFDFSTPYNTHNQTLIRGMGFKLVDNVLKGIWRYGGTTYETDAITFDFYFIMILRVQYDAATKTANFYRNGELVGSITIEGATGTLASGMFHRIDGHSTTDFFDLQLYTTSFTWRIQ